MKTARTGWLLIWVSYTYSYIMDTMVKPIPRSFVFGPIHGPRDSVSVIAWGQGFMAADRPKSESEVQWNPS